jgi:predicted ATPase
MKGSEVPQVDDLAKVRAAVAEVHGSASNTTLSSRHLQYARNAAGTLGLIRRDLDDRWVTTPLGEQLLSVPPRSDAERDVLRRAISESRVIEALAPGLLAEVPPTLERVTEAIEVRAQLATATARRRAREILGWRDQLLVRPTELPLVTRGKRAQPRPMIAAEQAMPPWTEGVRLQRVQVDNYGPLRSVDVGIGNFQVILGANATGKSTFLDALAFVADALRDGVERAWRSRASTFSELVWQRRGESFEVAVELLVPSPGPVSPQLIRYELSVGLLANGEIGVRYEALYATPASDPDATVLTKVPPTGRMILTHGDAKAAWYRSEVSNWKTVFQLGPDRLALAFVQESADRFPLALAVRDFLRTGWVMLALSGDKLRTACPPTLGTTLRRDGENLPLVVEDLKLREARTFRRWLLQVREALPEIQAIDVDERPDDKRKYLVVTYKNGLTVPSWRLSDGTLRILALILLGFLDTDALYLIEEPENGIHPQAIEAVHEALSTSRRSQVIVATHSPVFLGIVSPRDLLCFSHDGLETSVVPGTAHPVLQNWDRTVDLSTLFAVGVLG